TIRTGLRKPVAILEYRPKGDKKARIETNLHPLFANKKVWMANWMKSHQELQDEINYFPSPTVHDDIIDAMSMVVELATPTPDRMRKKRTKDHFQVSERYGGRVR
ncbi:MAG: hypothetical protein ACRDEA_00745, partial [Microcystaceae cyanobacterium]